MPPTKRSHRFLGLTSTQLGILIVVVGLNCLIFSAAVLMLLEPLGNNLPAAGNPALSLAAHLTPVADRFPPTWTPIPTGAPPTPKSSPVSTLAALARPASEKPRIADWEMLDSYRLQLKMQQVSNDAPDQFVQWKVDYKRFKPLSAAQLVISIDGPGRERMAVSWDTEKIAIGKTIWIKVGDDFWLQDKLPQAPALLGKWEGLERKFRQLQFVDEEVSGSILCRRYRIDEYLTSGTDFLAQELKATTHAQGDLWIVNQPDLPAVAIRLQLHMQPQAGYATPSPTNEFQPAKPEQSALVYDVEYEVTDLNAPISINPPRESPQPQVVMTDTPQPGATSTPSPDQIRRQMTALLWEDGAPGEIDFFHYFRPTYIQGLSLSIQARCVNVPCDANFIARVLEALASLIKSGAKFEADTSELDLAIHDGRTATWGILRASWQDVNDFARGRMTFEELTRKAIEYYIEQSE